MTLNELNQLSMQEARIWFQQACAASLWCQEMTSQRPYSSLGELKDGATTTWSKMQESDFLQAFEAHPMIGDINSLKAKFADTQHMASNEQQGASEANENTLQKLHKLNHQYLEQNGFIFIICATGLSAQTMLNALEERIKNDREQEIQMAAQEQIKITLLRLEKNL